MLGQKNFNRLIIAVSLLLLTEAVQAAPWSSNLSPKSTDGEFSFPALNGFALPDFSAAGYQMGRKEIPVYPDHSIVIEPDIDNVCDASRIQTVLNAMPDYTALVLNTGEYEIESTIYIPPRKVLRGKGFDKTKIKVNKTNTANFSAIMLGNNTSLYNLKYNEGNVYYAVADINQGSTIISLSAPALTNLNVGDTIIVKNEIRDSSTTYDSIRVEYNGVTKVGDQVLWPGDNASFKNIRKIIAINSFTNEITIDTPVTHLLQVNHGAGVMKITFMEEEMGIEDLAISFVPVNNWSSYEAGDSSSPLHNSTAIVANAVLNAWIRNIHSYPILNSLNPDSSGNIMHLHSRGITISASRFVTVENCVMDRPAHRGGDGNGYLFLMSNTSDSMIKNSTALNGRHNYMFFGGGTTGNVISSCDDIDAKLPSDSHYGLANNNLIENVSHSLPSLLYHWGPAFSYINRNATSAGAGYCNADFVAWGIYIDDGNIVSMETPDVNAAKGYIIGCSAADFTTTVDNEYREGISSDSPMGLEPASLYKAQFDVKTKLFCSFDTTNMTDAVDLMGSDDGLVGSGAAIAANNGIYGTAGVKFSGSAERKIAFTPNVNSVMGDDSYTLAAWIKLDDYSNTVIFKHGSGAKDYYFLSLTSDHKLMFRLKDSMANSLTVIGTTIIPLLQWVHVAVTCDRNGDAVIYLNGQKEASTDISSYRDYYINADDDSVAGQQLYFGAYFNYAFRGYGDNILIAKYAMGQRELTKLIATSYYSFNNGTAADAMGVQDGTIYYDVVNNFRSVYFNGINSYIKLGSVYHDIRQDDFSISVWTKYSSSGGGAIIKHGSGASDYYYFGIIGGKLKFVMKDKDLNVYNDMLGTGMTVTLESVTDIPVDRWVHLAVSLDRDGVGKIYINGQVVDSKSIASAALADIKSLETNERGYTSISYSATGTFKGNLDEIRFYKKIALNDNQIKELSRLRD